MSSDPTEPDQPGGDESRHGPPSKSPAPSPARRDSDASPLDDSDDRREALFAHFSAFSSPFPPPQILEAYGKVSPDFPQRVIQVLEGEVKHRRSLERQRLKARVEDMQAARAERRLGQWLGFAIGTVALVVGGLTAVLGAQFPGAFIGGGGVVALVAVFVYRRTAEQSEKASQSTKLKKREG